MKKTNSHSGFAQNKQSPPAFPKASRIPFTGKFHTPLSLPLSRAVPFLFLRLIVIDWDQQKQLGVFGGSYFCWLGFPQAGPEEADSQG